MNQNVKNGVVGPGGLLSCVKFTLILIVAMSSSSIALSQISHGGSPPSLSYDVHAKATQALPLVITPPDVSLLRAEDVERDRLGYPFRFAELVAVNMDLMKQGEWIDLPSEGRVWIFTLDVPDAEGLQLYFDDFWIPEGGQLFLYNASKDFVIGAFTHKNNNDKRIFATQLIPGDRVTLEYVQPNGTDTLPDFKLSEIGYAYRGVGKLYGTNSMQNLSGDCNVNVNCSPEGDAWKDVSRSVVKITLEQYICSGSLLNTTSEDIESIISTAFHCVEGIEHTSNRWVFYFNYERTDCSNTSTIKSETQTLTGCDVLSTIPLEAGADGALLLAHDDVPENYNPFYAGWDLTEVLQAGGVSIHHPQGDPKKISTITNIWHSATWNGEDGKIGAPNAHWYVQFAPTPNGHGVSEPASSGSPLFCANGLFRGVLSGGTSSCEEPYSANLFGKLSYLWNQHDTLDSTRQFKPWLDPLGTGVTWLPGRDPSAPSSVSWSMSDGSVFAGDTIWFTGLSGESVESWEWSFPGGEPSSSTEQDAWVVYNQEGYFDVSLTITISGDRTEFTRSRPNSVFVKVKPAWIEQNSRFKEPARGIQGITIVDEDVVWAWAFDPFDSDSHILEYTRTADGGKSWHADSIDIPNTNGHGIGNIFAVSDQVAWAAIYGPIGGGKIINTIDGGDTWTVQETASFLPPNGFPNLVYFWDENVGFCQGDPSGGYFELYTTTNGGENWERVPSANIPTPMMEEFGTVNMYDVVGDTVWYGTNMGRVFRSPDRGHTWDVFATGLNGQTSIIFMNAQEGIAYTSHPSFSVMKTNDGGQTWTDQWLSGRAMSSGLAFIPGSIGSWVTVGSNDLVGSSISYDNWESFNFIDKGNLYTSVAFLNDSIGFAGGFNLDSVKGGIYRWNPEFVVEMIHETVPTPSSVTTATPTSLRVYPNPSTGIITLSSQECCAGDVFISVVDVQGRLVYSERMDGYDGNLFHQINLTHLSKGLYIIRTSTANDAWIDRLMIR